ncbi:hypothetical protein [Methylobacterium sp. 77]|uniref:hypothetical protein n=1 Tax=Methylobacterium sp. 77 TaxID=1101192 RepID=UPI0012DDDE48|nr:hypothetical protein [Methylobacterium sp. 77]
MKQPLTAIVFLVLVGGAPAAACDCSRISPEDAFERAKLVADVKIIGMKRKCQFECIAKAKIIKSWKGEKKGRIILVGYAEGVSCDDSPPEIGAVQRIAAATADGYYSPAVCWSELTRPRSETLLDALARSRIEGKALE